MQPKQENWYKVIDETSKLNNLPLPTPNKGIIPLMVLIVNHIAVKFSFYFKK